GIGEMIGDKRIDLLGHHFQTPVGPSTDLPELTPAEMLIDSLALGNAYTHRHGGLRVGRIFPETIPKLPLKLAGLGVYFIEDRNLSLFEIEAGGGGLVFTVDPAEQVQAVAAERIALFNVAVEESDNQGIHVAGVAGHGKSAGRARLALRIED